MFKGKYIGAAFDGPLVLCKHSSGAECKQAVKTALKAFSLQSQCL